MKLYTIICAWVTFIDSVNSQRVDYANRIRNFSISSETNSIIVKNITIYQSKIEHPVAVEVKITKDIDVKKVQAILFRCEYEKSECEYFQKWTFSGARNMKIWYNMKDQLWTSTVKNIKPQPNFPFIQKSAYEASSLNIDPTVLVAFYPEVLEYYFQVEILLFDPNDEKGFIIWIETAVHSFVRRDQKRNRGNTTGNHKSH